MKMRKVMPLARLALLSAVMVAALPTPKPLFAGEDADLGKAISSAKTAADHEAIAAQYQKRADEAKAMSTEHGAMEEAYKKVGGALIEKQHIDKHCASLASLYKKIEKENEALAKAHEAMAKESK